MKKGTRKWRNLELKKKRKTIAFEQIQGYFSGCIYVERIGEQCYLDYYNSQKDGGDVRWDGHSSEGLDDQQV